MARDPETNTQEGSVLFGADLAPGALAGPWRIEALRARGGFGSVYRAHHAEHGQAAAVKVLHRFLAPSRAAIERFEREIDILQKLSHPNLVPLLGSGVLDDGRPYFAMAWIDGPTLDRTIASGAMPLADAISVMDGVCAGLEAAHATGVIHRDLKGANVLLAGGDPRAPRLVDFGVAKLHEEGDAARLTATGVRLGTPSCMAPEQIVGALLGPATDVYALGVLLFQMLTGRLPFEADTGAEVEAMHLSEPPPLASQLVRLPAAVDDVITRCLEKAGERRFARATDVAAALRVAAAETATSSRVQAARADAVGLHIQLGASAARATTSTTSTAATIDELRRVCLSAGYQVLREWPDALFVARLLGNDLADVRRGCTEAATFASSLATTDPTRRVRVHRAPVKLLIVAGATRIAGGELLALGSWPVDAATPGLQVSAAVRDGMTCA